MKAAEAILTRELAPLPTGVAAPKPQRRGGLDQVHRILHTGLEAEAAFANQHRLFSFSLTFSIAVLHDLAFPPCGCQVCCQACV